MTTDQPQTFDPGNGRPHLAFIRANQLHRDGKHVRNPQARAMNRSIVLTGQRLARAMEQVKWGPC